MCGGLAPRARRSHRQEAGAILAADQVHAVAIDEEMLGLGVGIEARKVFAQPRRPPFFVGAARLVQEERS